MTAPGGDRGARGFTLIEVMVAVAILAIAVVLVWGSFWGATRAKNDLEAIETRTREVRLGLGRMVRDLEHAYVSKNDALGTVEPRTFFIGDHHLGSDQVSFSYMGHRILRTGVRESETAIVTYFVEADRKDRSRQHLFRRESRRLGEENPSESGAAFVVCEDVVKLRLEYFDRLQDEWRDEWDTKNADGQPDRLPDRVRITVTVRDQRGTEVPFLTEARVFLQDALHFGS
jgi:general secretion pathway protein J